MPRAAPKRRQRRERQLPKPSAELVKIHRFPAAIEPPLLGMTRVRTPRELSEREEVRVRAVRPRWTQDELTTLQRAAARAKPVKASLGEHWVTIGVRVADAKQVPAERVAVFYSYTNQLLVEAFLDAEGQPQRVEERRFQPPATDEEIAQAVELARSDRRLRGPVRELGAGAIVVSASEPDDPRFGLRLIDVRFFAAEDRVARYMATVDLASGRVLEAGQVRKRAARR